MRFLAYAIRAVPDIATERRRNPDLADLEADAVAKILFHRQRQNGGGNGRLPPHQLRLAAAAWVQIDATGYHGRSLGCDEDDERELLQALSEAFHAPTAGPLVGWRGEEADLPLLRYRALHHGLAAPGLYRGDFRGLRHALVGDARFVPPAMGEIAPLLDLPEALEDDCQSAWSSHMSGDLAGLRQRCEREAIQSALIFLRLALVRGELAPDDHDRMAAMLNPGFTAVETP